MLDLVLLTAGLAVCPPIPDDIPDGFSVERERSWAVVRSRPDNKPAPPPGDVPLEPSQVGLWTSPQDWDVIAIHSAVLPTGQVLQYSYPSGGSEGSRARLWDPIKNSFTPVQWREDIFCSGLSTLPDGRVLITGGNDYDCEFQGRMITTLFDPASGLFSPGPVMTDGRWYPTNVPLADGRTLIFSGLGRDCFQNPLVELYTPGGGLQIVPEAAREFSLFPRLHLLSDGRIAHVGPENAAFTFTFGEGWSFVDWNNYGWRGEGTSVLIPGRVDEVLVIGGRDPVTNTCEIIDFKESAPTFRWTNSMQYARAHVDALILPDKTVLVVGGGRDEQYHDPEYVPEIFDPATETWTSLPPQVYGRMYHATTVLLPDGRVLSSGQDYGPSAWIGEIYEPAYLHRGPRPTITSAAPVSIYGQPSVIETPDAARIEAVVLVALSTVTHSVNFSQRLAELSFEISDEDTLAITGPASPTLAPPGPYMLFILDDDGVPSLAHMVRVGAPTPGDINADGLVNFMDLLDMLSIWGPCQGEPCPADLDGDGNVSFGDLVMMLSNWTL